jgi:hypothetical protein
MDSLINAAARALAVGDPLGALKRIALRNDAPALALRGIAMAQLGDWSRARLLLRESAQAFGPKESLARARCIVAEAEIALVSRNLSGSPKMLAGACATLEARGDLANAIHARHIAARRLLLMGHLDEAERQLERIEPRSLSRGLAAAHDLIAAGIAMRRLRIRTARAALVRAGRAAREAGIPSLVYEVESSSAVLDTPAARLITGGEERVLLLEEVETLCTSEFLVIDGCRHVVREGPTLIPLTKRPVLFALARALAEAWPADLPRETLVAKVFRRNRTDASYRARLRVEIGRLRRALQKVATISATRQGFRLALRGADRVAVLVPPVEDANAEVLAFLADGEAWSTSALALALGTGQRSVQRALEHLSLAGKVQSFGQARAKRWVTQPPLGFTTTLLLPVLLADV